MAVKRPTIDPPQWVRLLAFVTLVFINLNSEFDEQVEVSSIKTSTKCVIDEITEFCNWGFNARTVYAHKKQINPEVQEETHLKVAT